MNFRSFDLRGIFIALLIAAAPIFSIAAASPSDNDVDEMSLTLEENINHPKVNPKKAEPVKEAMGELRKKLEALKYACTTVRGGEVVKVTIPASAVFRPNAITVSTEGRKRLSPLLRYVSHTEQFKIIVAVHSDDTGDEQYVDNLTADRANAIDDFFFRETGKETNLIPYGLGHDEPLKADTSMANRAANRRIDIYFVPTEAYIKHLLK